MLPNKVDYVNNMGAPADESVLEAIHGVMHLVRSRQMRTDSGEPLDLNPMEGRVLGFFARHPGAQQSDLVAHTGRDKGQLARLIAGLKARGYLEARPDDKDRRAVRLYPTPAAEAIHTRVMAVRREAAAQAVQGFTAEEQRQLLDLLGRVRGNLRPPAG